MKKKRKNSSIITIDFYNKRYFKLEAGRFSKVNSLKEVSKNDTTIAYIANSEFIIEPVEISNSIPPEHVQTVIEDKVYEELRLDTTINYSIIPIKTAFVSNNIKYQTLIIDQNNIEKECTPIAKQIKYLDYLIPAPLLYKVFYSNKKLEPQKCDMFIYFGLSDMFVTFYYKGEFLYSKSLKYSVDHMYDRICQLAQEVFLTKEEFIEALKNNPLKSEDERIKHLLIQVLNECFLNINDVLIYTKRVYDIEAIRNLFIGFSWGYIDGIELYAKNYLNIESKPLTLLYTKNDPATTIDPIHALMALTAKELKAQTLILPNLTPYPKPAPFLKRPAGKMILTFTGMTILFLSPVIYDYTLGVIYKFNNVMLQKKAFKVTSEANHYKQILHQKRSELNALHKSIDKLRKIYQNKMGELESVYNKKFHYQMRSEQLTEITDIINQFDIKSRNITLNDENYIIEVESKDDKEITAFVKKLVTSLGDRIDSIEINHIDFDKKSGLYRGYLKLRLTQRI